MNLPGSRGQGSGYGGPGVLFLAQYADVMVTTLSPMVSVAMSEANDSAEVRVAEFCRLFGQVQRPLHRYINAMVFDSTDTYDILQETNLAMWEHFDDFKLGTNFLAWGRQIARLRVLSYYRMTKRRAVMLDLDVWQQLAEQASDVDEELVATRDAALKGCIEKLDRRDRELLHARYATDEGLEATAKTLGRTVNSLSQRLRRIRIQLRSCIEQRLALA